MENRGYLGIALATALAGSSMRAEAADPYLITKCQAKAIAGSAEDGWSGRRGLGMTTRQRFEICLQKGAIVKRVKDENNPIVDPEGVELRYPKRRIEKPLKKLRDLERKNPTISSAPSSEIESLPVESEILDKDKHVNWMPEELAKKKALFEKYSKQYNLPVSLIEVFVLVEKAEFLDSDKGGTHLSGEPVHADGITVNNKYYSRRDRDQLIEATAVSLDLHRSFLKIDNFDPENVGVLALAQVDSPELAEKYMKREWKGFEKGDSYKLAYKEWIQELIRVRSSLNEAIFETGRKKYVCDKSTLLETSVPSFCVKKENNTNTVLGRVENNSLNYDPDWQKNLVAPR